MKINIIRNKIKNYIRDFTIGAKIAFISLSLFTFFVFATTFIGYCIVMPLGLILNLYGISIENIPIIQSIFSFPGRFTNTLFYSDYIANSSDDAVLGMCIVTGFLFTGSSLRSLLEIVVDLIGYKLVPEKLAYHMLELTVKAESKKSQIVNPVNREHDQQSSTLKINPHALEAARYAELVLNIRTTLSKS